jgi:hypothetical protein
MREINMDKRGQLAVIIIIAVVVVFIIAGYFLFKGGGGKSVPRDFEPVYSAYLSCIKEEALVGANILGRGGGYIELPEFSPGSEYMPFSNQLNFLGEGVPYWYYISGNGLVKEQVPSKEKMESELDNYLVENLDCDFSEFEERGFEVSVGEPDVKTCIEGNYIEVEVKQEIDIDFGEKSWNSENHEVQADSNLGKFYDVAKKIYEYNKNTMFLEEYGVDILRLYAPVDGSEVGCSSRVWDVNEVRTGLIDSLEVNVPMIKIEGDYYRLSDPLNKYFVQSLGDKVDVNVNFRYSGDWPMKMEVWPSEAGIMKADPIGLQEGLGMLGFCYVQYHFVYDFAYPVLIQVYSNEEVFQFPVVIFINKNHPREPIDGESVPNVVPELCLHKNVNLTVYTYNNELDPVEARIDFKCFDTTCDIGETKFSGEEAVLKAKFPQCVNGYIIASAEGYETRRYLFSSMNDDSVLINLNKKYKLNLELQKSGMDVEYGLVSFSKDGEVVTIPYPEQTEVELTAGQYEIKAYIYNNSSIVAEGGSVEKCVDIPKSGVFGIFGFSEEKCFNMEIPDQTIDLAVSGGGTQNYFIGESELQSVDKIIINAESFEVPKTISDVQTNYNNVEVRGLDVLFD